MTRAAPPVRPAARSSPAKDVVSASLGGFRAFVVTALAGQAVGFATWVAGARAYGARLPLKLGWLYLVSFNRVGIRLTLTKPFGFGDGVETTAGPTDYTVHVAFLAGTIMAGLLLWLAGRAMSDRPGWLLGVAALAYAVPIFVGSQFVTLRFPDVDIVRIEPVAWESFALPFAFALMVATVGRASTRWRDDGLPRVAIWLRAGWRMFAAAIVLAFIGFVVLAGVRPDASGAYVGWIGRNGSPGTLVATHHLLLLPDQSLWILAPAMGSCDSLIGSSSDSTELCGRTFTLRRGWGELVSGLFGLPERPITLAAPFLLFALVPAIAVVAGAARLSAAGSIAARMADGAASGVVFALLVWVGALASRISIDEVGAGPLLSAGPEPIKTGLVALLWGVVGGALGAGLFAMRPQEGVGASDAAPVPAPPRPTSV